MDPYEFLFLILPLTALVVILVAAVYKLARGDGYMRQNELRTLNELIQMGAVDKDSFYAALQGLVNDEVIDKGSFERLGKLVQESFEETEETVAPQETA